MKRISACVIVKNEEKNIVQWAENMKKLTDDLIVVDTGSTDRTVEQARRYGAKIFHFAWNGSFADAKNFALEQAAGDWIVFLDADEYFTAKSIASVRFYIEKYDLHPKADALVCKLVNVDAEDGNRYISEFYNLRIFRNRPWLRYENCVHEELKNKKRAIQLWVIEEGIEIIHTGYSRSIIENKLRRNLDIIQKEIEAHGENPRYYAYLCDCYYGLKEYAQAEKYARLHIASGMKALGNERQVQKRLIECMFLLQRERAEIRREIEKWTAAFPEEAEFVWYMGEFFLQNQQYAEAEDSFLRALALAQKPRHDYASTSFQTRLTQLYCALGHIQRRKNEKKQAAAYYLESLRQYRYHAAAFAQLYLLSRCDQIAFIARLKEIYDVRSRRDVEFIVTQLQAFLPGEALLYYRKLLSSLTEDAAQSEREIIDGLLAARQYDRAAAASSELLRGRQWNLLLSGAALADPEKARAAAMLLPKAQRRVLGALLGDLQTLGAAERELLQKAAALLGRSAKETQRIGEKKTSIVILTYNQLAYTQQCIQSIRRHTAAGTYEIIAVDNASTDGTAAWLKEQRDVRCIFNEKNEGFPKGCNQAMALAQGTEILLLNNDVVVTPRWLEQMLTALYSSCSVGAVGCVTNACGNGQQIEVPYQNPAEMAEFAEQYNHADPGKWERRLMLTGFCFLVKRGVARRVGPLDEIFSPGNFEDDDYSLRILMAGYELLLCKDTFIHHFGGVSFSQSSEGYQEILQKNLSLFREKWGLERWYSLAVNARLVSYIEPKENLKILEIGCGCGGTLLKIKDAFPRAAIYGIEANEKSAAVAGSFAHVRRMEPKRVRRAFPAEKFDYILFGGAFETLQNPEQFLGDLAGCLKETGCILAQINNLQHWSAVKHLIEGRWPSGEAGGPQGDAIRFFTYHEIVQAFTQSGYPYLTVDGVEKARAEGAGFLRALQERGLIQEQSLFNVQQFLIRALRKDQESAAEQRRFSAKVREELAFLLRRMENDVGDKGASLPDFCREQKIPMTYLAAFIDGAVMQKTKVFMGSAALLRQRRDAAEALRLLAEGRRLYPQDADILGALASIQY